MESQSDKDDIEENESEKPMELSAINLRLADLVIVKFKNNEKKDREKENLFCIILLQQVGKMFLRKNLRLNV